MAHTPTPWIVDPAYPSEVQTSTDETICSAWHEHAVGVRLTITGVLPCSLEESAANAAFIVRAVNAFEANEALIKVLVEALKPFAEAAASYDPAEGDDAFEAWRETFSIGALRTARKALRKAEAR